MIYILGAGATAREILNIYKDLGLSEKVMGFIEENYGEKSQEICCKKIMDAKIIETLPKSSVFIGAIGSPLRKRWIEKIKHKEFEFDTVIHSSAVINDSISIGEGCVIYPGVIFTCDTKVGKHSIINIASTISHDCEIGNFVTICPGVNIAGNVKINDGCWIGIGTKIIHKVTIGNGSFIGAGSVVTKDIPDNVLALGVPAKPIKKIDESDWRKLI